MYRYGQAVARSSGQYIKQVASSIRGNYGLHDRSGTAGDEVIVRTARGVKRVYIVSVEEYAGGENDCMRKAIRKRVRGGKKND